ncbi:MAG: M23 family metallopeptidase [Spirochaetaceae bacterium]|nr:M23 family metallopeptidase [Spirochaetaceae bacterium]
METFQWQTYRVRKGDSVYKIAQAHAVSMDAVIASNGMSNAKKLYEGQEIKIPNMDGIPYTVRRGDSLLKISGSMGVPLTAILDANDIETDDISPGTVLFIPGARMKTEDLKLALGEFFKYPVRGRLSSPFGWRNDPFTGVRRYHAALDLAASTGTTVNASMDGQVATVGYNATYGKFIILSHSNNFQTLYAHLSATSVSQGTYVSQGAKIGEVGSTGYSTGPHLHFAVYKNGKAVNPLDFLNSGL